ncbi:MAG: 3-deoxy-8-phosphooctulonate synthase, partial [Gammaproteobacteria bacterium]
MTVKTISIGEITIANDQPLVLVGGLNVLESQDLALTVAERFR